MTAMAVCARLCPSSGGNQCELQADCGGGNSEGAVQGGGGARSVITKHRGRAHHRLRALVA